MSGYFSQIIERVDQPSISQLRPNEWVVGRGHDWQDLRQSSIVIEQVEREEERPLSFLTKQVNPDSKQEPLVPSNSLPSPILSPSVVPPEIAVVNESDEAETSTSIATSKETSMEYKVERLVERQVERTSVPPPQLRAKKSASTPDLPPKVVPSFSASPKPPLTNEKATSPEHFNRRPTTAFDGQPSPFSHEQTTSAKKSPVPKIEKAKQLTADRTMPPERPSFSTSPSKLQPREKRIPSAKPRPITDQKNASTGLVIGQLRIEVVPPPSRPKTLAVAPSPNWQEAAPETNSFQADHPLSFGLGQL